MVGSWPRVPASGQRVELWWRKRRLVCAEPWCPRKTFTQPATAVRPRAGVTERLRQQLADGERIEQQGGLRRRGRVWGVVADRA
jgi:hypothetical protein